MENHVPITADLGSYIWGVLLFEWVLIFKKSVASVSMGTYICGVLVFDGYLYSREYGICCMIFEGSSPCANRQQVAIYKLVVREAVPVQ